MVDLQSTNRVSIKKCREVTFGVTPATPAFKAIRETSSALAASPGTAVSNEIRQDRQVVDLVLLSIQAGGNVAKEISFGAMGDDLEEALQGTWANAASIAVATIDTEISDITATTATVLTPLGTPFKTGMLVFTGGFTTAANNGLLARVSSSSATTVVFPGATFSVEAAAIPVGAFLRVVGFQGASGDLVATAAPNGLTSTVLDFTTLGLAAGQWVKIGGAVSGNQLGITPANNDFCRILSIAAHTLLFDRVPVGWGADAGTGQTVQLFTGDFLTNASTKRSNTIERQYLDHSPVTYEYLRGQVVDKLTTTVDAAKIATYTIDYVGADAVVQTTRFSGATDIAAGTDDVLNAASNVGRIGFDGATVLGPNFIMKATAEFNNNLRRQMAVGSVGAVGIGNGEFGVTGTLDFYFGDKTVLDKLIGNTLTSLDFRIGGRSDNNKETLVFDFPSIKISSGSPSVSGKNSDVMMSAGFQAIVSATYGYTASVTRFYFLP